MQVTIIVKQLSKRHYIPRERTLIYSAQFPEEKCFILVRRMDIVAKGKHCTDVSRYAGTLCAPSCSTPGLQRRKSKVKPCPFQALQANKVVRR
jgi:hypothetical protein